jgi:hypothetical protein
MNFLLSEGLIDFLAPPDLGDTDLPARGLKATDKGIKALAETKVGK